MKKKEQVSDMHELDNLLISNMTDNNGGSIGNLVEDRAKVWEDWLANLELKESMIRLKSSQTWV